MTEILLPAKGPQGHERVVRMYWHCKLPKDKSEIMFIREESAQIAYDKGYDIIRVRMAIHDTRSVVTRRGRDTVIETVAGEPWHWTLELQHGDSECVDSAHIYTDTAQIGRTVGGLAIFKTKGLATAGVTKGANGKVVDKVVETWEGGTRKAVGNPNQSEKIKFIFKEDYEEGEIIEAY